jgi:type I restriction enzyme S subunit
MPPIKEQQKIAAILSTIDDAIKKTDEIIEKTAKVKNGLIQDLLIKGIGHSKLKQTEVGKIPQEWEVKRLDDVAEFKNGKAHEKYIDEDGVYILINSKFISSNGTECKLTNQNLNPLTKGDITMVMSDIPNGKALAKCFLVDEDEKYTLNQRICSLMAKQIDEKYLYYYLNRNKYFLNYDNGVGQTNLRKSEVLECPILVPSIEEQQKIVHILTNIDSKIHIERKKQQNLLILKQGLIQVLLTGKVRVKVDETEVVTK